MPVQTTTVTGQQAIPEQLMPYFTGASGIPGLLPKAQEIFSKGYAEQYGDPLAAAGLSGTGRVAPMSAMQQQVGTQLGQMGTPTQFGMGAGTLGAGAGAIGMGLGTLGGMTDAGQVGQFMSPYMQNVLDVNKAEALRDAQKGLTAQNLASAKQGTYGGARNALMMSEADRNLQTKLGGIQAQGMQSAFDAAQKAQLAQAQQYGQFGQQLGALGQAYGALGTAQQASDIDRIKTQGAYGDLERGVTQQELDAKYQDFLTRIGYPQQQLGSMANILRGVPIAKIGETSSVTTPPPSFASQLAGMGLTGLSLYNMFGNK
jgi:hypothetical protein